MFINCRIIHSVEQQKFEVVPQDGHLTSRGLYQRCTYPTRPEPDPTRKSGSFGLACDYVGSGSDFNFRVEIGFKVIVFKFSFGYKLCNKLSECWYLYYTFAFCSFKINSNTLLSVFYFTVLVNVFYSRYNSVILRLKSSNYKMDAFFGLWARKFSYSLHVGSVSGQVIHCRIRRTQVIRRSGRVQVCWIFCRVGLTVYI